VLLGLLLTAPSQELEPSKNPERFTGPGQISLFADTDNASDLKNLYVNRLFQHALQPLDRFQPAFRFVPIVNAGPLVKKRYVHHLMG
jgi:hypothetical protein